MLRIIDNQPPLFHAFPISRDLKLLTLSDIYKYNLGVYMYANMGRFESNFYLNSHATRSGDHFAPAFQCLTLTQNQSIKFQAPANWNNIPSLIKNSPHIHSFRRKYKKFLLSQYDLDLAQT